MNPEDALSADLIEVSISHIHDLPQLASQWQQLERKVKPVYFLSWGWTGTWLRLLPDTITPQVLTARYRDETVGLAILVRNTRSGRHLVTSAKTLVLNETGNPDYDLLTIEYNDFLVLKEYQTEITGACLKHLLNRLDDWDEILIRAADSGSELANPGLPGRCGLGLKISQEQPSWYVDLQALREGGKTYLDSLSSNTRYQIRRATRECEKCGELEFSTAGSSEEALDYLSRLSKWHHEYWRGKGHDGCFSNPFLLEFHQSLIRDRFEHGEIQLVRIRTGDTELGYLYNLVTDNQVFFYQSGFNYAAGKKLKPGLIAHYKAIEYNFEQGMSVYNFLASDDRYKRSLSTDRHRLIWVSLQKDRLRFRLENTLDTLLENCKDIARQGRDLYRRNN
ncbi:MAG: GNAT family N-acetyltransferase [Thiogranum sp.]